MSTQGCITNYVYGWQKHLYYYPRNIQDRLLLMQKPAPNITYQSLDANDPQYPLETKLHIIR